MMQTDVEVKERPIIMSGESARALLDGRKTQTRRVIKPQPPPNEVYHHHDGRTWRFEYDPTSHKDHVCEVRCPYGAPGDHLWVRETHWIRNYPTRNGLPIREMEIMYRADKTTQRVPRQKIPRRGLCRWRPSIHMPRWASRLTLEVVSVGVERVQDISYEDIEAEGIHDPGWGRTMQDAFWVIWDRLNAKRGYGWDENPWVWVIKFRTYVPYHRSMIRTPGTYCQGAGYWRGTLVKQEGPGDGVVELAQGILRVGSVG